MLQNIILGITLGIIVSSLGYYFVHQPSKLIGKMDMDRIKKKVMNRYLIRNFANIVFLFILFRTTNTATLVSAAFGLTMVRNYLIVKQYLAGKG